MSKSVRRVEEAAKSAGLEITVRWMPESTRTATEAAQACECAVAQIVKSMIFEGAETGTLKLLLISGQNTVDPQKMTGILGESLSRANPKRVRDETGFAIGGVAPIGHLSEIETWIDSSLLSHDRVWAAAGAPNAVFSISPQALKAATQARECRMD